MYKIRFFLTSITLATFVVYCANNNLCCMKLSSCFNCKAKQQQNKCCLNKSKIFISQTSNITASSAAYKIIDTDIASYDFLATDVDQEIHLHATKVSNTQPLMYNGSYTSYHTIITKQDSHNHNKPSSNIDDANIAHEKANADNKNRYKDEELSANDISDDVILSDSFFDDIKYPQHTTVSDIQDVDNCCEDSIGIASIMHKMYVKNENNSCDNSRDHVVAQVSKLDKTMQSYLLRSVAQSIIYELQGIIKQINNGSITNEKVESSIRLGNCFIEDFPNYLIDIGDMCGSCDVLYRIQQIQDAQKHKNNKKNI